MDIGNFIKDHLELRPFNAEGIRDGNFNYIHIEHVADLIMSIYKPKNINEASLGTEVKHD
jgi:hypothetical protein